MFCPQHVHLCPNLASLLLHSVFSLKLQKPPGSKYFTSTSCQEKYSHTRPCWSKPPEERVNHKWPTSISVYSIGISRKGTRDLHFNSIHLAFLGNIYVYNYNISKRLKQSSENGDKTDAFVEGHRNIKLEPGWKFPPWWLVLILPEDVVHSSERELSYPSGTLHVAIPINPERWPHWCKDNKVCQRVTICFLVGYDANIHICNCKPNQKNPCQNMVENP